MPIPEQFRKQQYINVETYRKNGEGVKTPVWFVEMDDQLCVNTESTSGKVKRLRRNPSVKVAPCKMEGTVTGSWAAGSARFLQQDEAAKVESLLSKKYGLIKSLFQLTQRFQKKKESVYIAIKLE